MRYLPFMAMLLWFAIHNASADDAVAAGSSCCGAGKMDGVLDDPKSIVQYGRVLLVSGQDKALLDLLQQRYGAALEILKIKQQQYDIGQVGVEEILLFIQRVSDAEIVLAESPEKYISGLENKISRIRKIKSDHDTRMKNGIARKFDGYVVTYWLAAAEIELHQARQSLLRRSAER